MEKNVKRKQHSDEGFAPPVPDIWARFRSGGCCFDNIREVLRGLALLACVSYATI